MSNHLPGIDEIFCINLEKRKDRWEYMEKQFETLGLNVSRFQAIDGRVLTGDNSYRGAVVGFNTSQIRALEDSVLKQHDIVMLLEDDVELHKDFNDELIKGMNELPSDWNLCYLGGSNMKPPKEFSAKLGICEETLATTGYIVKVRFARDVLLPIFRRRYLIDAVDSIMVDTQKIFNMHIFCPRIAHQIENFSDIQNMIVNYSHQRDF